MILTFCVVYQYQNQAKEVFAFANDGSQIKEGFSIYHSPKLGFEIAYPSDWVVEESPMGDGIYINAPISTQGKIDNSTKSLEEVLEEVKGKIEDIESGETESILCRYVLEIKPQKILITSRQ
jgi:hypothetical protein